MARFWHQRINKSAPLLLLSCVAFLPGNKTASFAKQLGVHICLTAPPSHLYLSYKIMFLDLSGDCDPPFGPTVGWGSNFPEYTTKGCVGKNSTTSVASYLALTFFLKTVRLIVIKAYLNSCPQYRSHFFSFCKFIH